MDFNVVLSLDQFSFPSAFFKEIPKQEYYEIQR